MLMRILLAVAASLVFAAPVAAQKFDPGSVYICPNDSGTGLDCYLDAVVHLYTMCRHVKSIEIIEFGLPKAQEGVNGAKSEYCVDKQKINITRPYQAALRESTGWREAVDGLRNLQAYWLEAMLNLKWRTGEAVDAYEDRVIKVYDELGLKIEAVRIAFATPPDAAGAKATAAAPAKPKGKPKATAAAKAN
jgi:hypothetical protein